REPVRGGARSLAGRRPARRARGVGHRGAGDRVRRRLGDRGRPDRERDAAGRPRRGAAAAVAASRGRRGRPPLPAGRDPVPGRRARRGRRGVRWSRVVAPAGGDLVRALDRSVGAASRDVGGRVGRARGAGCPRSGSTHGLRAPTVRPPPDEVPQAPSRASRWVPKEVVVLRRRSWSLEDFNALAMSLGAGMADVRGCLILSGDGLVLGAHPAEAERTTTPAWVRFAAIGDPERGFAQFGTETLCYVRRGPYAGFAVAGPGARPGLMIAHMEQVLLAAEQSRWRHEWLRGTEAAKVALRSEPSSSLHLEHPAPDPLGIDAPAPVVPRSTSAPSEEVPPLRRPEPVPIDGPPGGDAETPERPVAPRAALVRAHATQTMS